MQAAKFFTLAQEAKMRRLIIIISSVWLTGTILAQQNDAVQDNSVYDQAYRAAMADSVISAEEQVLLDILKPSEVTQTPDPEVTTTVESSPPEIESPGLNQSGRWPLVLQNIALGTGLYGWAIPYVLNAEDGRWYIGSEMISAGAAFYLTYQYTKGVEVTHARTQMMRYGELLGLRYGAGLNKILDLSKDEVESYDEWGEPKYKEKRLWAWVLMGAVPAGHYAGELLYEKYQPSNGQAWVWTTWTGAIGFSARLAHPLLDKQPEEPEYPEWDWNEDWSSYRAKEDQYYTDLEAWEKDNEPWEKRRTISELLGYPLGMYLGQKLVENKNYTFGDAMMIMQGWGYGYFNTMMLQSLLFDEGDEELFFFLSSAGALGHMFAYDRWIAEDDFTFGQSMLMFLGSGSGIAFGFGTAIILDITDKPMLAFALGGYGAGTYLTRKTLSPKGDGSLTHSSTTRVSISPTALPSGVGRSFSMTPAIGVNISFR